MAKQINKKHNKDNKIRGKPFLPEFFYALFIFIGFFLLSFRKIFGIKGILGHNWDWSFPATDVLFKKIDLLSRYAWWDFDLGQPLNLTLSQIGPNSVVKLLAFVFPPKAVIVVLFFIVTFTAFFSFKKLLDFLNQKGFLNYLPALLFAFSPFLFNDIIGGSWYMWVSYAASPLFFLNLSKFAQEGKIKNLFGFLLTAIFVIGSLQHFFLIQIIVFGYLIFQLFVNRELNLKKVIFRWFLAQAVLIIFNLYWLLPFFLSFGDFIKSSSAVSFTGAFASVRYSTQNLLNIASLVGYLDRNLYYYALTEGLVAFMALAVFVIWGSIISFFVWGKREAKIKASCWLLLLFLAVLIIKGGNDPFGELTMWIYNHLSLMKLYRSPQHLIFVAAFIIPVLFSFTLNFFYQTFVKYQKLILAGFLFCLFFWLSGWWANGDLGHEILKNKKRDYVDFYQLSPVISEVYKQNETSKEDNRIFFLPASNSPAYLPNEYQNLAQGGQPEYMYLKNPTFTLENIFFANELQNAFCHNLNINYINYLSLFSVRQVVLRADIYPLYSQIDPNKCWNLGKIKNFFDNASQGKLLTEDKNTALYQINNENFLPLIYIPEKIIDSSGDKKELKEITDFKNYQIQSAIYLGKENENLRQFKPQTNEIFIKPQLTNGFLEEESAVPFFKLQSINYPYVQWQPGSFIYNWILKREAAQEKSLAGREKDLFQAKIYNGAKRISETIKFFNRQLTGDDLKNEELTQEKYYQKMGECLTILAKMKESDRELFQTSSNDFYAALKNHQDIIRQSSLPPASWIRYEDIFNELDSSLEELKFKHDFHSLKYNFEVENEGEYQLFLKTDYLGGQLPKIKEIILDNQALTLDEKEVDFKDWQGLLSLNLNKGEHQLVLSLEEGDNILSDNWQQQKNSSSENLFSQMINNYQPDALYQLSFDYTAYQSNAGFYLTQDYGFKDKDGKPYPLIIKSLPLTKLNEFRQEKILIKALSLQLPAQISFFGQSMSNQANQSSFKNIKMERVFEPMVVLKKDLSGNNQDSVNEEKPDVSFVKINPIRYQAKIQGANKPFNLIFNQSFNKNWKIYLKDLKKPISESSHWLANGYANAWQIDVTRICADGGLCTDNADGSYNMELVVEYYPQRFFYIGLFISGMILISCLFYLILSLIKNKKS